ncbi:MAG: 3'-5' exonuclease [Hyphomonadaceae bacterium]|nr:3'-5' exonuclease [Clostridia bacterium]
MPKMRIEGIENKLLMLSSERSRGELHQYVVVDLIATGLDPQIDHLVEVAAIRYKNGEVLEKFVTLVDPRVAFTAQVVLQNGIREVEVRHAPPIDVIMPQLVAFIGNDVVIGHNTSLDVAFIKRFAHKQKLSFPNCYSDTFHLAYRITLTEKNKRMKELIDYLSISNSKKHRAYENAIRCAELLKLCFQELRQEKELSKAKHRGEYVIKSS